MPGERVDIGLVEVGRRLRRTSPTTIEALTQSILEIGLLHPLTVYRRQVIRGASSVDGYGLISGANRLEACRMIGMEEIDVNVVDLSELQRQIAECDENLIAPSLTPSERARFTRRRKEAYEALHPETRHGAIGGGHEQSRKLCDSADRFTADTARATGQSERLVQLNAERGEKVIPEVLDMVRGTKLDTGAYLDRIKRVPLEQQIGRVRADLSFPPGPDCVAGNRVAASSDAAEDNLVTVTAISTSRLQLAWDAASEDERNAFVTANSLIWPNRQFECEPAEVL